MDVTVSDDQVIFSVSHLWGENVSEESTYPLESLGPTLVTLPDTDLDAMVLLTNLVS